MGNLLLTMHNEMGKQMLWMVQGIAEKHLTFALVTEYFLVSASPFRSSTKWNATILIRRITFNFDRWAAFYAGQHSHSGGYEEYYPLRHNICLSSVLSWHIKSVGLPTRKISNFLRSAKDKLRLKTQGAYSIPSECNQVNNEEVGYLPDTNDISV
jgi:hypothetical protein